MVAWIRKGVGIASSEYRMMMAVFTVGEAGALTMTWLARK